MKFNLEVQDQIHHFYSFDLLTIRFNKNIYFHFYNLCNIVHKDLHQLFFFQ